MKRATALALTFLITGLLVVNSADFYFRQPYQEVWDNAANSLSVLRAKHFAQAYGPYSRWGFYHPGPTLFYVQACGEWLFHDALGWTRSPFAGQALAHALVMSGFFVAALMILANWLPPGRSRWWFLCGALALAVPHFTAMGRVPSYDVLRGTFRLSESLECPRPGAAVFMFAGSGQQRGGGPGRRPAGPRAGQRLSAATARGGADVRFPGVRPGLRRAGEAGHPPRASSGATLAN